MTILKASSTSNPSSIAGAMVAALKEKEYVEIQTVGAGALNQAVKAIAVGRGFVAPSGEDLICSPSFEDIVINGESRTAIKLAIKKIKTNR